MTVQSQTAYFKSQFHNPSMQNARLRDYFAVQALAPIFATLEKTINAEKRFNKDDILSSKALIAKEAYDMADALLAERNRQEDEEQEQKAA